MNPRVIVAATTEPVSVAEAMEHLRYLPNDDSPPVFIEETTLRLRISAAREYCEQNLAVALTTQTVEYVTDSFPLVNRYIELPYSPVGSIISVRYIDGSGAETVFDLASYVLDQYSYPNRVSLAFGAVWPTAQVVANAVRIRYEVGYTTGVESPDTVPVIPAAIKQAMLLLIGHWDDNRSAVELVAADTALSLGVAALLKPYQLRLSMA